MKKLLPLVMLFGATVACFPQAKQRPREPGNSARGSMASLAKGVDGGAFTAPLFSDSDKVSFRLVTSWIPGEKHKGMFRYKLDVFPESAKPPDGKRNAAEVDATEQLMKRVHRCAIILNLFDSEGFILRKITVRLGFSVDDDGRVIGLSTNDSAQMDAQDYRNFVGSSPAGGGSWNVSWVCPNRTP